MPLQPRPPRFATVPLCRLAAAALYVLLGLAAAPAAKAEDLQELVQAALDYDATYLSARASLEATRFRRDQQYALRRPNIGLQASVGRSLSSTPEANTRSATTNAINTTVTGSQPLFNRANDKTIAQAEKLLDVARADFEAAEQDLILRVSQAYFDVLAGQDTLATTRASMTAISEQVASAKRNFEVGTATITDTREAQARFDLARANEIQAENDLLTRRIALDQLVGRANVNPQQLAVPVRLPPLEPLTVDDWVARGDAEHPQVRRASLNVDVARLETEKAEAAHLPVVALNANVGRGYSSTRGDVAVTGFPDSVSYKNASPGRSAGISITLNLPLYAGNSIQNRIRETLALEDRSLSDLQAARRSVAQSTRTVFYGVRSGAAQVVALEAAEASSLLALEATQLGYRVGVRVNIDVLNAQAQLFTTRAQLARARYDVVVAGLRLRQASGRLTLDDVAAVNALLQP